MTTKTATTKSTTTSSFRKPENNGANMSEQFKATASKNAEGGDKPKFKKNRKVGNLFTSKSGNPCISIDTYPEESITLKKGQFIFLKKKDVIINQIETDLNSDKLSDKARDYLEKRLTRLQKDDRLIAELEIVSEEP